MEKNEDVLEEIPRAEGAKPCSGHIEPYEMLLRYPKAGLLGLQHCEHSGAGRDSATLRMGEMARTERERGW